MTSLGGQIPKERKPEEKDIDRILEIISSKVTKRLKEGKIFQTIPLAEEIVSELKKQNLEQSALIFYINSIINDIFAKEG